MKLLYTIQKSVELSDEQLKQCVEHLRSSDFYNKKDRTFYFGHVLDTADSLGFVKLEDDYQVPDGAQIVVEGKKIEGRLNG